MSDQVLEVGGDGAFDVSALSEKASELDWQLSETLREKGNAAFKSKAFGVAVRLYSQAIGKNPHNKLLYSNRSTAYYHLKQFENAHHDAQQAVALDPTWTKAYVRKAAACEALRLWREALETFEKIVELETDAASSERMRAAAKATQIKQMLDTRGDSSGASPAVQKGFFHSSRVKAKSGIYAEKDDVVKRVVDHTAGTTRHENEDERRWRYMLKRLKGGCNKLGVNAKGERVVLDDGVFAKLLQEREFQALVYPGIPVDQLVHAPKNLQELLEDPWYEEELLTLMPKVQAKAHSVLENVKKRGAAQGEIMDAGTEQILMPQVLQEAFGREVLAMVHRINAKKHVLLANDERTIANPEADQASWDQLSDEFLSDVLGKTPPCEGSVAGAGVLDYFMGEDWISLVQNDAERMIKNGLLLDVKPSSELKGSPASAQLGTMRFLDPQECEKEYPALGELLEKLHALPHEINAKRPQQATLCAQFAHCTAIHHMKKGDAQRLRLDCGAGERDNGFKLTCVYFIKGAATQMRLQTALGDDACVQCVEPKADRLVVLQSQRVFHEITRLEKDDDELVFVAFWIHGKQLR